MVNIRKFLTALGILPVSSSGISAQGELEVLSSSGKLNYHNGTTASPVVTEAHTATLTNKSMDGGSNTFTNLPSTGLTGQVPVANGGTGDSTLTNHGVLVGQGTSAIAVTAVGATGTVLHGNTGADPSFSAVSLTADVSGTLPVSNGGTGDTTLTAHGILVGNGTGAVAVTSVGATNTVLHGNTGADPTYSAIVNADITNATIDLTTKVTGTLPVANGGTGQSTYTDGQLLIGNTSGNTLTKSTLTAGSNVTITNGNGSITIAASGGTASPLTTKGDLYGFSTVNARIPVGSDTQVLVADSSQTLGVKWAAAPSSAINLMAMDSSFLMTKQTNSDAEVSVGDWVAYADAAATIPVDMTGGSPNTTITRNTSSPLDGTADFKITVTTGASRQGEGVSCVVNIPPAYRGKALTLAIPYATTGTIASGDFVPYAYDVTNSSLLAPSNTVSGISGSAGTIVATFLPTSTCASLRIGIHIARTSTGAATINFDDVQFNAQIAQANIPVSDWTSFTMVLGAVTTAPTKGTVVRDEARWRRVGDSMEIVWNYRQSAAGTAGSGGYYFTIPNGNTIDTSKLSVVTSANSRAASTIGLANIQTAGTGGNKRLGGVRAATTTQLTVELDEGTDATSTWSDSNAPFSNSDLDATIFATIPISGWSSGGGTSPIFSLSDWDSLSGVTFDNLGTTSGQVVRYRRVGDSIQLTGYVVAGTTVASALALNLPTGYTIDTTKAGSGSSTVPFTGNAYNIANVNFGANDDIFVPFYDGSSTSKIYFARGASTTAFTKINGSVVNSNQAFAFAFTIPISGWTSTGTGTLTAPRSEVTVDGSNGHGSTNTKVVRYANTRKNVGTAITYADSSTLGATFTINETGIYCISVNASGTGGAVTNGIVINSSATTTNAASLTYAQGLRAMVQTPNLGGSAAPASWTGNLTSGDIIYIQDAADSMTNSALTMCTVTKISN